MQQEANSNHSFPIADIDSNLAICGTVTNRSGGHQHNSASQVMNRNPKWAEFVRSIENWDRVELGTLTLDGCSPLPNAALDHHAAIATEPSPDTLFDDPTYIRLMVKRGERRFYRGIAKSLKSSCRVLVSQQRNPACNHRLEIYASRKLRTALDVMDGDRVCVEIDQNQNRGVTPVDRNG